MKNLLVIFTTAVMLFGIGATADAGMYFSGNLGFSSLRDADVDDGVDTGELTFDPGGVLTLALGGNPGNGPLRAEFELGFRSNDLDQLTFFATDVYPTEVFAVDGDISATTMMGNLFVDLIPGGVVSPFFGGGIGLANLNLDIPGAGSEDDTVFAYQVGAGMAFGFSPQLYLDLQYRYLATADPNFAGLEMEYASHNVMGGLRFYFY